MKAATPLHVTHEGLTASDRRDRAAQAFLRKHPEIARLVEAERSENEALSNDDLYTTVAYTLSVRVEQMLDAEELQQELRTAFDDAPEAVQERENENGVVALVQQRIEQVYEILMDELVAAAERASRLIHKAEMTALDPYSTEEEVRSSYAGATKAVEIATGKLSELAGEISRTVKAQFDREGVDLSIFGIAEGVEELLPKKSVPISVEDFEKNRVKVMMNENDFLDKHKKQVEQSENIIEDAVKNDYGPRPYR